MNVRCIWMVLIPKAMSEQWMVFNIFFFLFQFILQHFRLFDSLHYLNIVFHHSHIILSIPIVFEVPLFKNCLLSFNFYFILFFSFIFAFFHFSYWCCAVCPCSLLQTLWFPSSSKLHTKIALYIILQSIFRLSFAFHFEPRNFFFFF